MRLWEIESAAVTTFTPSSISVAPLLTIGIVTGWTLKIKRKVLYSCPVEAGRESQQRAEAQR